MQKNYHLYANLFCLWGVIKQLSLGKSSCKNHTELSYSNFKLISMVLISIDNKKKNMAQCLPLGTNKKLASIVK